MDMPAISLAALPGRRKAIIKLAQEAEARGFAGIYLPSLGDNMSLATALASATQTITFGTAIVPIYFRAPLDLAQAAAFVHELSDGRRFVLASPTPRPMRATACRLANRSPTTFVETIRAAERIGELPPIVATLRKKMIGLAGEIGDGLVFANASRSHMNNSLSALPAAKLDDPNFFIGNMIPTCIDDDEEAAAAVNRRTLTSYAMLPNYRNYWREAGYEDEMDGVEAAIAAGEHQKVAEHLSDRWLADNTLFGPQDKVLEGLRAWYDAGVRTPILVPSSAKGNQLTAIAELFELCEQI